MIGVKGVRSDIFVSECKLENRDQSHKSNGENKNKKRTHLLVHEPERDRLVSDKCLVVAFRVRDTLLPVPPVRKSVANVC